VEAQTEKLTEVAAVAEKKEGGEEEEMRIPGSSLRKDLCRPSNE
jgi:hypothetical protein